MKLINYPFLLLITIAIFFSGCATIVGGSRYHAHINVKNNQNANIIYKGKVVGKGKATLTLNRRDANKFSFIINVSGCDSQVVAYKTRTFRGGALVGTIITWTGVINGVPIPWGVMVDAATGANWKPNIKEEGIKKLDYKNFKYEVEYINCSSTSQSTINEIKETLDVVYLKNGSIIKGLIIGEIPNEQLKLRTTDGNIFTFKYSEIEKVLKEIVVEK